ncbi:hypothetical protein V4C53_29060 [Paraburkholderia azotifigens]|uniref:hypothetical protein n=1 Tax=Paraburkholderia azotifigens TaxID=2057004 RepID=UPI00316BFB78
MDSYERQEKNRYQAYMNAVAFHNREKSFPEQVFNGHWQKFLFFQSDYLFSSEFVDTVHDLLRQEQAHTVCLINLGQVDTDHPEVTAAIYLDDATNARMYRDRLIAGGPDHGWLFAVDRYVCTSDAGNWCIYCEKDSDIAVVGLRVVDGSPELGVCFQNVFATTISALLEDGEQTLFPFNQLLPEWREGLLANYTGGTCSG